MKIKFKIGLGVWITAAFIGPGTLTVCTLAGVQYGFSLLWALLLSTAITIFIQNTVSRVSIFTSKGLAEVVATSIRLKILRFFLLGLIFTAIFIGNSVYEAGNLTGAILGLSHFLPSGFAQFISPSYNLISLLVGGFVAFFLLLGKMKIIKNILVCCVIIMSISFLITVVMLSPSFSSILSGLFIPRFHSGSFLTVIALIGTTVVPYNLFLHSALLKRAKKKASLSALFRDTFWAVALGGFISMCIVIAAASVSNDSVSNIIDLGKTLQPLYGVFATSIMAVGLFAAGITSAITAPIAAGYVIGECLGWKEKTHALHFKIAGLVVLIVGVFCTFLSINPIQLIKLAQVTNGLLLPIMGIFLFWMVTNKKIMGVSTATIGQKINLGIVVLFFLFISLRIIFIIF